MPLEDPIEITNQPPKVGIEDFDQVNENAPADAEPFVEPEEAPRNDEVEEPD